MSTSDSDATAAALFVASRALVAIAARSLAAEDELTLPQFRALVVLARPDRATVNDLATELDIHASTTTRLCDRLVRKGLIRRVPRLSADRREVTLTLTVGGRRLVDRVTKRRLRDLAAITSRMSLANRRNALAGLRAFSVAAGEVGLVDALGWNDQGAVPATSSARRSR